MSSYSFEFEGKTFAVKVPQGVSEEQARGLFKQQADTGSLVGIKVGQGLSAATQAAAGLPGALAQLQQGAAGALGALTSTTNLNSITAGLGVGAGAVKGQISSALAGGAAALNSLTTGAAALGSSVSGAVGGITGSLSGSLLTLASDASKTISGLSGVSSAVSSAVSAIGSFGGSSALTSAITGAAASAGSLASKAVTTLQGAIGSAATNGINVADFAKQMPSLSGLGSLSAADVQGTLAQASRLIGQSAGAVSNALGAGKFGFNVTQLEKAGLVKPGTGAAFLAQGANELVAVLKSPTVWTGKDGVKSLDGLLKNPGLQDKIQQDLMKTGLDALKSVGVPTDKLSPQALSGLATNAAKSVEQTVKWVNGSPTLPTDVKEKFNAAATNGAFAVNLTQTKIEPPVKQEIRPEPAAATVNAETQNAAAKRVVGNDKVPTVTTDGAASAATAAVVVFASFIRDSAAAANNLNSRVGELWDRTTITQAEWNAINDELQIQRSTYNARAKTVREAAKTAIADLPNGAEKNRLQSLYDKTLDDGSVFVELVKKLNQFVKDLANKIAT